MIKAQRPDGFAVVRTLACVCAAYLVTVIYGTAAAQDVCPNIVHPPITQTATPVVKDMNSTCTLDPGGYAKTGAIYTLHFRAAVQGTCTVRAFFVVCYDVYTQDQIRYIWASAMSIDSAGVGTIQPNPSTVENYDTTTTPPTNTSSTGFWWYTSTPGAYVYKSSTNANATNCNIMPTQFNQDAPFGFTINSVQCAPAFLNPSGQIPHLRPTQILIYTALPGTAITDAINAVATNLTNVLTRVSFTRAATAADCAAAGSACVTVNEASLPTRCSQFDTGNFSATTGEILGSPTITLSSSRVMKK